MPKQEDADKPFGLEVEVDRGVATFPIPLPAPPSPGTAPEFTEFLDNPWKGWGEARNTRSSPAYVEIAARPSATITVSNDDDELAQVNWGQLQADGKASTPRADLVLVDRGKLGAHQRSRR